MAKTLVPSDPALVTGALSNGLRYAIMRPSSPQATTSLRLGIDVGSFEETDSERGLAHFVEHLAFRSTRNFPDNTVEAAFSKDGVAFGRDHNGATDLFSTAFMMDLARADAAGLGRAFTWLRDVADGIVFDPTAIERERGVVLAEKEARDSLGQTTSDALLRFRAPGMRIADRAPIGIDAVLRAATPATLEAFYRRWYRPEHAVVAVVSDLPIEVVRAQIEAAFGDWRSIGRAPQRTAYDQPDPKRELDVFTRADASGLTSADICRLTAASVSRQDYGDARRNALNLLWRSIFDQRLAQLRKTPAAQMLGGQVDLWTDDRTLQAACISIKPTNDAWAPALASAQAELLRFQAAGPTELEVETAIERVRARFRGAISDAAARSTSDLADRIVTAMLEGQRLVEPRQDLRAFDLAVEDISPADVHAAFKQRWTGAGPLVSVVAPKPPSASELRDAWLAQQRQAGLAAYSDRQAVGGWAYAKSPAGVVAEREVVKTGGFVRIRFRNGVTLNFKRTAFSPSQVAYLVRFGAGRREIKDRDLAAATLGAQAAPFGGLGKHSYDDIVQIAELDVRNLSLQIGNDSFFIGDEEPSANIEDKLQVTAAYLSDPGFRPDMNPLLHEGAELTYRMTQTRPAMRAATALAEAIAPDSPLLLPPKAELLAVDNKRIEALLKPAMTTGPIDVTVVGDIDEATAVRLVAASFGALAPRPPAAAARTDVYFASLPMDAPPPLRVHHAGPPDQAVTDLIWPLYVATPARRREEYAISLLASVFAAELRRELRGVLGKTYAPSVVSQMPDHADQGMLSAHLEAYPGDLDSLTAATMAVARRLAAGLITDEQLAAARAPMLAASRQELTTNSRWVMALSRSSISDQDLRDILGYEALLTSIRLDEVKKAAADWLTRAPIVATATSAQSPTQTSSGEGRGS